MNFTPTCISCANNQNGKCKLTGKDMYENRMLPVSQGGCGEQGMKHVPKFKEVEIDPKPREPYLWA